MTKEEDITYQLTDAEKESIAVLASKASIPGAEGMSLAFCNSFRLEDTPSSAEQGAARVEYFKSQMTRIMRWSQSTLVNAGLAMRVSVFVFADIHVVFTVVVIQATSSESCAKRDRLSSCLQAVLGQGSQVYRGAHRGWNVTGELLRSVHIF